ncbi:MAG: hypothetical protein J7J01_04945 [Methanophagales archaeon]|nr:hypothetical protein [Methanophagales archaeon]
MSEVEKVRIEHNLVCTAHNLKVIWAKMAGKVAVLGKIGGLIANSASELRNFLPSPRYLSSTRLLSPPYPLSGVSNFDTRYSLANIDISTR